MAIPPAFSALIPASVFSVSQDDDCLLAALLDKGVEIFHVDVSVAQHLEHL